MVISHGARLGLAGVVIGVIVALAGTRALRAILFQTSATDVLTFAGVTALLLAVSVWASFVPARRAMKVNPVEALRSE
jgi:ABC-type lipoprotein release transport system permease subunit